MHKENHLHTCRRGKIVVVQWWSTSQLWNSYYCMDSSVLVTAVHYIFIFISHCVSFFIFLFCPPSALSVSSFFFFLVTGPSSSFLCFSHLSLYVFSLVTQSGTAVLLRMCTWVLRAKSNLCNISVSCCSLYCILRANSKSQVEEELRWMAINIAF